MAPERLLRKNAELLRDLSQHVQPNRVANYTPSGAIEETDRKQQKNEFDAGSETIDSFHFSQLQSIEIDCIFRK